VLVTVVELVCVVTVAGAGGLLVEVCCTEVVTDCCTVVGGICCASTGGIITLVSAYKATDATNELVSFCIVPPTAVLCNKIPHQRPIRTLSATVHPTTVARINPEKQALTLRPSTEVRKSLPLWLKALIMEPLATNAEVQQL